MSNEAMNAHIRFGEPCGSGATLSEVADWAGDMITELAKRLDTVYEAAIELFVGHPTTDILHDLIRQFRDVDNVSGSEEINNRHRVFLRTLIDETKRRIEKANAEHEARPQPSPPCSC